MEYYSNIRNQLLEWTIQEILKDKIEFHKKVAWIGCETYDLMYFSALAEEEPISQNCGSNGKNLKRNKTSYKIFDLEFFLQDN